MKLSTIVPVRLPKVRVLAQATMLFASACLAAAVAHAGPTYTWNGSASSDFATAGNWTGAVAVTGNGPVPPGTALDARISVQDGAANQLIYTAAQGHTVYAPTSSTGSGRALFIGSGGSGSEMTITGGTFESRAANPDGMANAATATLTIDGGSYVNNVAGSKTFDVVYGGGGNGTLNIDSGSFTVTTLKFGDSSGQTGTGTVNLNGGTLAVGAVQDPGNVTSNFNFNGGVLKPLASSTAFMTGLNNVSVQSGGAIIDTDGFDVTIDRSLLDGGDGLTKNDAGTLTLSGSGANTYTGMTSINAGTLVLAKTGATAVAGDITIGDGSGTDTVQLGGSGGNQIANSSTVTINGNGVLDLNGQNETLGVLTGTGIVDNTSASAATLTVGAGNATSTFSGTIQNTGSGTLGLTKTGSGTLTLDSANTYHGATTVATGGVLLVSHNAALGNTSGVSVASGAQVSLSPGITVDGISLAISGQGAGNLGALQVDGGAGTWTGPVTLGSSGTRVGATGGGMLTIGGPISGTGLVLAIRTDDSAGSKVVLTSPANSYGETHVVVGTLQIDGGDNRLPMSAVLRMGNTSNVSSATFDLNGFNQEVAGLISDGTTMSMTVTNTSVTASTLAVVNGTDNTYVGKLTGSLSLDKAGAGTLVLSGASTLTLGGANTYTGATTITAGVLNIRNPDALGTTDGGTTVANNSARLELQGGITVSGESVTIAGQGGDSFGALRSVADTNEWAGDVILGADGARLGASGGGTLIVSGKITDGANTYTLGIRPSTLSEKVVLSNAGNDYGGSTDVVVGTLQLAGGDNRLPVGTVLRMGNSPNIDGARFDLGGFNQQVAGLQSVGSGNMIKDVTNTSLAASTLTVDNAGNDIYNGTVTGNLALVESGAGTLTLGGTNTYSLNTTIAGGTGNDVVLTAVPEPATLGLLAAAAGLALLGYRRRLGCVGKQR